MRHGPCISIIIMLVTASCGDAPPSPTGPVLRNMSQAETRIGAGVTSPVMVHATLVWTVDQSEEALAACGPRPGLALGSGEGQATYLGRFRVMRMDHCSVDLATVPPALDADGEFRWQAADGSTVEGSYSFLFLPGDQGGFFTMTVEGGTGRFVGATGRLDADLDRSDPVVCDDALCLDLATWPAVFTGWISLPRP